MLKVSSWVCVVGQFQELVESNVISEERSREYKLLTSNDDNLLTPQKLMSDLRSKSTDHMASSIYDNLLFEHAQITNK